LDIALGGNGNNRTGMFNGATIIQQVAWYIGSDGNSTNPPIFGGTGTWRGARWTGHAGVLTQEVSNYWASTGTDDSDAHSLLIASTNVSPQDNTVKSNGFTVRCVRDFVPPPQPMTGCNDATPSFGGGTTGAAAGTLGTITWGNATNQDINSGTSSIPGTGGRPTQIWSGAVQAQGCRKGNVSSNNEYAGGASGNFNADCRQSVHAFSNSGNSRQGHYFSWCAVRRFADSLCPAPWRVPTQQDFVDLDMNLVVGSTGMNRTIAVNGVSIANQLLSYTASGGTTTAPQFGSGTGGHWGGARWTALAGNIASSVSHYWSSTELNATSAFNLRYNASEIAPQGVNSKDFGFAVRCVRNP